MIKIDILIFLTGKEKAFVKYMGILEKVRNIIKNKLNIELIYSKKYLKPEKKNKNKKKKRLLMFICTSNID